MFDGRKYKMFARTQLATRWRVPVISAAIYIGVMVLLGAKDIIFAIQNASNDIAPVYAVMDSVRGWAMLLINFIMLFAIRHLLIKMSKTPERVVLGDFIDGFCIWTRAIAGGLWYTIFVSLWSFLFIIPGVVKSYAYFIMFHIMTEFPTVSAPRAMQLSKLLTQGHKADILVMQLSFLPWMVLSCLTCGVGLLWLIPYYEISMINAYHALLREALDRALISEEDLK